MLASNSMTDVIYWNWFSLPGGPGKAIADKQILRLNELMDKYAPAYLAHLKEYPERRKMVTLDDGTHYMFPKFKHDKYVLISHGFQAREDWMKKLDLKTPKSMDEWYAFRTAMKKNDPNGNGKADEIPFVGYQLGHYSLVRFSYAFGTFMDFVMDGVQDQVRPHGAGLEAVPGDHAQVVRRRPDRSGLRLDGHQGLRGQDRRRPGRRPLPA